MAPPNLITYLYQGEVKVPVTITIRDDNRALVDLSEWSVQWIAGLPDETPIIDVQMTPHPDQVNFRGQATYLTVLGDSTRPVNSYRWKAIATHPDGRKFEYPKTENGNWGTLVIRKLL